MELKTPHKEIVTQTASVIPFAIKLALVCGVFYYAWSRYNKRFVEWDYRTFSPPAPANISYAEAESRADAIEKSAGWFGGDFETLQRNLAGLNYNGYVRLHNAFGKRNPGIVGFLNEDLELEPWLRKVVHDDDKFNQLSVLTNGILF